jgi:GAF domain-containing protein
MNGATGGPDLSARERGALRAETLYGVIGAIARGPDLRRVLPAIVELLVDATSCHACFVYLREDERLRLRAASRVYAHLAGQITMGLDEGLCGWVARNAQPAYIRDHAQDDPRTNLVPELDEERFQSMIAVPLMVGSDVIGVVVLHTEAPFEFGDEVVDFLVPVASVVAGAIDNARLYEATRSQVERLSALIVLVQQLAATDGREALQQAACAGTLRLLEADSCRVLLRDERHDRLETVAAMGADDGDPVSLLRGGVGRGRLVAPLTAGAVELGAITVRRDGRSFQADDLHLLEGVASQLSVALQNAELIDRLTEENLVRALFDALAEDRVDVAEARARKAGYDLGRPHVIVALVPASSAEEAAAEAAAARAEQRLRHLVPGALCDTDGVVVRALLPIPGGDEAAGLERIDDALAELADDERMAVGRGRLRRGLGDDRRSLTEAMDAAVVGRALDPAGGLRRHETLGAFSYLVRLAGGPPPHERYARAAATVAEYDRRRGTELVPTLERLLDERGGVVQTARALFIHPNTLRQRLERIESLTDLDLAREDLLALALAIKLMRLQDGAAIIART